MKIAIVCTFDTCFDRVRLLKSYYKMVSDEVIVIASDFSHVHKEKYNNENADILIDAKPYYRNLSVARLRSHYDFAKKVEKVIADIKPDYIHSFIPANSLTKFLSKYKKDNPTIKLIYDIIDLWPETLPINRFKSHFPFTLWKNIRDNYLDDADVVFTECTLFQEILHKYSNEKYHTLYWSKQESILDSNFKYNSDTISFCYLGSINNIIDIDLIINFLVECRKYKSINLHIIGKGESKEIFINKAITQNIQVFDHDVIYSQEEKQKIFDLCHYGLNVMKSSVVVGLTMKSLDYMCGGLPLINTIQGDTKELCEQKNIGINVNANNIKDVAYKVCNENEQELKERRNNIRQIYTKYFSEESFFKQLDKVLKLRRES